MARKKCGFIRKLFGMCPMESRVGSMKRYTSSFAASRGLQHDHPERTAMRESGEWDVEFQVWPSREAMLTTIRMQAKRAPNRRDWKPVISGIGTIPLRMRLDKIILKASERSEAPGSAAALMLEALEAAYANQEGIEAGIKAEFIPPLMDKLLKEARKG